MPVPLLIEVEHTWIVAFNKPIKTLAFPPKLSYSRATSQAELGPDGEKSRYGPPVGHQP